MFFGLWITAALVVLFLLLMAKTFGWAFYQNANRWRSTTARPQSRSGRTRSCSRAGWCTTRPSRSILILVMSLWFFGWVGTLFLSSTRVIFAAAFDRVLPDRAAEVSEKRKVPLYSLILMLLPAVGLSAVYAYSTTFRTYTLDATLVIAVTYLFSAIAVVLLPFVKPDLWRASPASKVKLLGVPIVPVSGVITIGLLGFNLLRVACQRQLLREQPRLAASSWARCTCWRSCSTWSPASCAGGRASTWASSTRRSRSSSLKLQHAEGTGPAASVQAAGPVSGPGGRKRLIGGIQRHE